MIFEAVILAAQPMTFNELLDLLAIKIDEEPSNRRRRTKSVVISACSPFVEVDYDSDFVNPTLRLVHKSIGDFLIQDPTKIDYVTKDCYKFFVSHKEGNANLGRYCLTYLSYHRYSDCPALDLESADSSEHGFLKYASVFWHRHLQHAGGNQDLFARVRNFLKSPNFWTCVRVQSKYAPHMFARLSYNSKSDFYRMHLPGSKKSQGDQDYFADALPPWLGEYDSKGDFLVWGYHMFVREWAEVLVRHPNGIQEYFAQLLGPRSFWNTEKRAKGVEVITAEGPKAIQSLFESGKAETQTTPIWTSEPTSEKIVKEHDKGSPAYINDVLEKNGGEWHIDQRSFTKQIEVTATVYRYQMQTSAEAEADDSDEGDSDDDTNASPKTRQPVIWFLAVTDGEGLSHWYHYAAKSVINQKSAPLFIPHTSWLLWAQDESVMLLNIKTWSSTVIGLPDSEKSDLVLISQGTNSFIAPQSTQELKQIPDHHYSATTDRLHRASMYSSNKNPFFTIRHKTFQVAFPESSSEPPKITPTSHEPQETAWRGASPNPDLPISFCWHEDTLYAALGSSAVKILRFPALERERVAPIQILNNRIYIPSSAYSRKMRFLIDANPMRTSLKAVFFLSEASEFHLPAVKLVFTIKSDDWEDYDPSKHGDEIMGNSSDFLKGAYAAKEMAFSVPIRSGLDWRRSVYVTCW